MSLIGQDTAVISIGSSCQTSRQINSHVGLISQLVGDDLVQSRLPFDWVIASPTATAKWLDSSSMFPPSPDDLRPVEGQATTLHWPVNDVFFWHDFRSAAGIDVVGTFDETKSKYEYGFRKLRFLSQKKRVIAVVSNTQNNLPEVLSGGLKASGFHFTESSISNLKSSLERRLGRECELLCVTYDDRCDTGLISREGIQVARIEPDESRWEGDAETWEDVLRRFFVRDQAVLAASPVSAAGV